MRRTFLPASLCLVMLLSGCTESPLPEPDAVQLDMPVHILRADKIYTGNPDEPEVDAVIIGEDGRIVMTLPLGSDAKIEAPSIIRTTFAGTMFPGFTDGHAHLSGIGQRELTLDLAGTQSISQLMTRIEGELSGKPAGELVYGRGWIETGWPEARMPRAADIDPASPDNPVILVRADGHALLANSAAMAAAGITDQTPDPGGGLIERDTQGQATGIFVDNAMSLIRSLVEAPDEDALRLALKTGAEVYASRGWTGLHNMSVTPREAPLMAALDEAGALPQRVHNAYDQSGFDLARTRASETDTIRNRAVKIYMDGALGSRGALLFEPYADRPETSGLALRGQDETLALMTEALETGVQIAVHAIGDKANADALDWMEIAAGTPEALRAARWRIEHAQILEPTYVSRFGEGGIIASMQPSHAIGDLKFAPDRLGFDRLLGAYAWQGILNTGGLVVGGSDAPVEVGSPLIEFYASTARKALDGSSGAGWHPEQAVSRADALAMFTSAPAYASFQENTLGTLEPGKWADISIFDRDLMTIPEADILKAQPVATLIAGDVVWQRDEEQSADPS